MYLWGTVVSSARIIHIGPWIVSLMGEKENQEALLHVTGDLVHLKVKDIKTIEE
jgi:hypothetical protein